MYQTSYKLRRISRGRCQDPAGRQGWRIQGGPLADGSLGESRVGESVDQVILEIELINCDINIEWVKLKPLSVVIKSKIMH